MIRRLLVVLTLLLATLLAAPTGAHATTASKAEVLAKWTQPTAASTAAWNAARLDRATWASYGFDWTTDYCSSSPDNPLGFRFSNSCWHHDFGYRNYKDLGTFPANKARVDDTFYADLRRVCAGYSSLVRPACYSLAWTYYQAVRVFGSLSQVQKSDLDRAEQLLQRNV
jgi:hypothetical protein